MPKIAIISKPQKPELETILRELVEWLRVRNYESVFDPVSAAYLGMTDCCDRAALPLHHPELAIVLGGDGTLLSAARAFARYDIPILSVNLGSLGFLTEVPLSEMYITLQTWIEGHCSIDERAMMHAELWRGGKVFQQWDALNDVVLSKGAIARMGDYTVRLHSFAQMESLSPRRRGRRRITWPRTGRL